MLTPVLIVEAGTISDVVAVPEPVPHEGCDNPEDSIEAADPHNTVQKQEDEGETFT